MAPYEVLQWISGAVSIVLLLCLLGSTLRAFASRARDEDKMWMLIWSFVLLTFLYRIRFIFGAAPPPRTNAEYNTGFALAALSILISVVTLWKRWFREGFRW